MGQACGYYNDPPRIPVMQINVIYDFNSKEVFDQKLQLQAACRTMNIDRSTKPEIKGRLRWYPHANFVGRFIHEGDAGEIGKAIPVQADKGHINTFNCHRLASSAWIIKRQDDFVNKIFGAHYEEDPDLWEDITDPKTLIRLANECGMEKAKSLWIERWCYNQQVEDDMDFWSTGPPIKVGGAQPAEPYYQMQDFKMDIDPDKVTVDKWLVKDAIAKMRTLYNPDHK